MLTNLAQIWHRAVVLQDGLKVQSKAKVRKLSCRFYNSLTFDDILWDPSYSNCTELTDFALIWQRAIAAQNYPKLKTKAKVHNLFCRFHKSL